MDPDDRVIMESQCTYRLFNNISPRIVLVPIVPSFFLAHGRLGRSRVPDGRQSADQKKLIHQGQSGPDRADWKKRPFADLYKYVTLIFTILQMW